MNPRNKLIVGNWKMHGSRAATVELLASAVRVTKTLRCDIAVCVPFPFLDLAEQQLRGARVALGAQDVSAHPHGAFTGQVSVAMLREFGCRFVIVGHSERRTLQQESDAEVARKARAALDGGLTPIVCVGETLEQREAGQTKPVVLRQIDALLLVVDGGEIARCVVAYEPVWAIGTGRNASAQDAQAMHAVIRARIAAIDPEAAAATLLLYGGSVKPSGANGLFEQADIDGALIGGASLIADDFAAIAIAAG